MSLRAIGVDPDTKRVLLELVELLRSRIEAGEVTGLMIVAMETAGEAQLYVQDGSAWCHQIGWLELLKQRLMLEAFQVGS